MLSGSRRCLELYLCNIEALQGALRGTAGLLFLSKDIFITNGHFSSYFWGPFTPVEGLTEKDSKWAYAGSLSLTYPTSGLQKMFLDKFWETEPTPTEQQSPGSATKAVGMLVSCC